jgi:hypothetical protein
LLTGWKAVQRREGRSGPRSRGREHRRGCERGVNDAAVVLADSSRVRVGAQTRFRVHVLISTFVEDKKKAVLPIESA